ncbi:MAG: tetratricopeptide repeat protein [Proteobacteria bacterium]|nr:tetratricopeptide repeat protein [Pseudomonadota bacterium]
MHTLDLLNQPESGQIDQLVTLFNRGQYAEAAALAGEMTVLFPRYSVGWKVLGAVLKQVGRTLDALAPMQKAIVLAPSDAVAHSNLGVTLKDMDRLDEAETCCRRALEISPNYADAYYNLGNALSGLGRLDEAEVHYRHALGIKPDYADAHTNLGVVLNDLGRIDDAELTYHRALRINPDCAEAINNLGVALKHLGRTDEAEVSCRQALTIKPDYADAHRNLAVILEDLGHHAGAEASCRRSLCTKPNHPQTHYNLGNTLSSLGRLSEAEASYRRALAIKPDYIDVHNNLGNIIKDMGRLDEAEASYRRALRINPDFAEGQSNLGIALKESGQLDESIACFRAAVALDPSNTRFHSNLVYTIYFHPTFDERAILDEARNFGLTHCSSGYATRNSLARGDRLSERQLHIGYVSPDFRNHCQSLFTIPLLSNHDRTKFKVHCYAQVRQPDEITKRLATYADVWRPTICQSDEQLATTIAGDGIDILVDLTMHMAYGRPALFAQKPAPIQIAWLAYPGTTGIPAMDYRLTDPWLDPPALGDDRYTETSIRLPDSFWCYAPLIPRMETGPLPALTAGHITFGCLNNFFKVSDDTLRRWSRVMVAMPSSRLILLTPPGSPRKRVLELFGRYGVEAGRIEFVGRQPQPQYLQTYNRIDLCLDTLPYNGHTTSIDSYWMGVPVITQVGHTVVGRAGWSQLNNLGLPELAAFDEETFVNIAVATATDLRRLSELRQSLRKTLEDSPLMDAKRFTRAMENVYRQVWRSLHSTSGNDGSD